MSENYPPSFYEDAACRAETANDYGAAARLWNSASAVSIGHNRSARYDAARKRCIEKFKAEHTNSALSLPSGSAIYNFASDTDRDKYRKK